MSTLDPTALVSRRVSNLPRLPEGTVRDVFVDCVIDDVALRAAQAGGWRVQDVRLLSEAEEAIKARLEGVRMGTILVDKDEHRILMDEAKVYGLLGRKKQVDKPSLRVHMDDFQKLLEFGIKKA